MWEQYIYTGDGKQIEFKGKKYTKCYYTQYGTEEYFTIKCDNCGKEVLIFKDKNEVPGNRYTSYFIEDRYCECEKNLVSGYFR